MPDDLGGSMGAAPLVTSDAPNPLAAGRQKLLAPAWHTAVVVLLAAAASIAGVLSSRHLPAGKQNNLPTYLASIALEWLFAGLVLWGLRQRHTPLSEVLGKSLPGIREWFVDAGVACVFWIVAVTILGILAVLLRPMHLHPEQIRDTVSKLAPTTPIEMLAWIVLCVTAAICEEFIFRGYLQLQFARMSHRVWVGVVASAVVFGFAHGYEGWTGMLLIVAFGVLFSNLRLIRGTVRAGMMAHAWHDFFSGMVLYALAHHKLLS
jgi:membrane protease YdiL (CAAX protease family)